MAVGRWKVVVKELKKRDLPVLGSQAESLAVDKYRRREWYRGPLYKAKK